MVNCKTDVTRDLSIDGTLVKAFTREDYFAFSERDSFDAKVNIKSKTGASMLFHFFKVVPEKTDHDYESHTKVLISPNINVEQLDDLTPLVTINAILPALFDETGNIIGDGTWY